MSYAAISFEKKGRLAIITLQRPEHHNAVDCQLAAELRQACQELNQETEIAVVIVTAAGNEFFSAGTDWQELSELGRKGGILPTEFLRDYSVAHAVASLDKAVIGAINGNALGQGLELALACDIRLAAPHARFGFPPDRVKAFPFDGATQFLPRVVGKARALELLLLGDIIDAEAAIAMGLVNRISKDRDVRAEAEEWGAKMAERAPLSLRFAKEAVLKGMDLTLEQGLRLEGDLYFLLHTTADRTEGITAFREKRKPTFRGT